MAVAWESVSGDNHYQVRTAGRSIRLYKDGVFHSQWNESRPLSGGVWDLLFLPSLFLPSASVKNVLLLGVGGGAVIRQYIALSDVDRIVGVELDPVHLQVARDHFGIDDSRVELIEADAIEWARSYKGPVFDVVIEDLFREEEGEPVRVMPATSNWFRVLRSLLKPGGALIINFEDAAQFRACDSAYREALDGAPDYRFAFSLPTYGNCVGAFLAADGNPRALRRALDDCLTDYSQSRASAQKFRVRRFPGR